MQLATRLAVAIVGFTITLLGVVMLVTSGPGWLMILLGLGVLSVEFVWARRLLRRLKEGAAELACRFRRGQNRRPSDQSDAEGHVGGIGSDSPKFAGTIFRSQRVRPGSPQPMS